MSRHLQPRSMYSPSTPSLGNLQVTSSLSESIYRDLIKQPSGGIYWLEIYLLAEGASSDPFSESPSIRYEDLHKYDFLVKLQLLTPQVTHNDKLNLQKIVELYCYLNDIDITKKFTESYIVNQSRLFDIAYFVANRIIEAAKPESLQDNIEKEYYEHSLSEKYFFKDMFETKMKINSKLVRLESPLGPQRPHPPFLPLLQPGHPLHQDNQPVPAANRVHPVPGRRGGIADS
jgi:hypothetical protein